MSEKGLVSVVIPCYNAEKYIEESVYSIINQTYNNLEIICVDDCSTDNTLKILKQLALKDRRVIVLQNPENLKISKTLNRGIEYSTGEYIARMDADDIALPVRIEKQIEFLEANPEVGLCGTCCEKIDATGKHVGYMRYPLKHEELKSALLFTSVFIHPTVVFRKKIFNELGGYRDLMPVEDFEYWIRIIQHFQVANLMDVLLKYRWHGDNVTVTQNALRIDQLSKVLILHQDFFINQNSYQKYNLRFMLANWGQKSDIDTITLIKTATNEILRCNKLKHIFNQSVLRKVVLIYQNLAYLSCVKSSQNTLSVRGAAFLKVCCRPWQTWKNIQNRILDR